MGLKNGRERTEGVPKPREEETPEAVSSMGDHGIRGSRRSGEVDGGNLAKHMRHCFWGSGS